MTNTKVMSLLPDCKRALNIWATQYCEFLQNEIMTEGQALYFHYYLIVLVSVTFTVR